MKELKLCQVGARNRPSDDIIGPAIDFTTQVSAGENVRMLLLNRDSYCCIWSLL